MEFVNNYLSSLMSKPFLVLSGSSGTGKTRLALQVAQALERSNAGDSVLRLTVDQRGNIVDRTDDEVNDFCGESNDFTAFVEGSTYPISIQLCSKVVPASSDLHTIIARNRTTAMEIRINRTNSQNRYEHVPVGADWNDSKHLLGYVNPFSADGHPKYELTTTLRLIIRALHPLNQELPFFLILDEMNLSHVERYFSNFLSLMEATRSSLDDQSLTLVSKTELSIIQRTLIEECRDHEDSIELLSVNNLIAEGKSITLPHNLFIVGTINVDETTYMFSPKVLDRAHVIELNTKRPSSYFDVEGNNSIHFDDVDVVLSHFRDSIIRRREGLTASSPKDYLSDQFEPDEFNELYEKVKSIMNSLYDLLYPISFDFGYRVVAEVIEYLAVSKKISPATPWNIQIDRVILQKILPKLHGNKKQLSECLRAIESFLSGNAASFTWGGTTVSCTATNIELTNSKEKINKMRMKLDAIGYTSFIT
ncbi:hypothetical protein [Paenibacillus alginolyticus]|uniref:ATPase dynein-related AAA domain-containing protein n=1 Tax=Paenibacillus alginolyticus TaxID=59839 RepID=A0ABT4GJT4_9BACL|nr:hypothetical protein [Paenibacillus alginolyticus]MCY9696448.1 hypothetical protein [Paenibacillus alginolyticus]MEC0145268.1 hypothetical protein [Paenibacillus alginolyticus]